MPRPPRPPPPPRPPVAAPIFEAASSWAERSASFVAARTRSWSISTSSGSTAAASIFTSRTSRSPVTLTLTIPPPALASTTSFLSCSWAFIISACICCTWRSIWFMLGCFGGFGMSLSGGGSVASQQSLPGRLCRSRRIDLRPILLARVEVVLEPLQQLVLRQQRLSWRALGRLVADRVVQRRRAPDDLRERVAHEVAIRLDLLLREPGARRKRDGPATAVDCD